MTATEQQQRVVAAVLDNTAIARVFDNMLKEVGSDPALLAQYSKADLKAALEALPDAPGLTKEFKQIVGLTNGTLEARQGTHSAYEFRLTLKDVQPGQTQKTLEALVAEMNEKFPSLTNYPSCGFNVHLSGNGDLPNYNEAGDVVIRCSSLIHDSTDRSRSQTITRDGQERISQEALLSALGLFEVPNDMVRAVAGMYRVAQGFPANQDDIGTERDKGDVFEGKMVRTKRGSRSGCVASYQDAVFGSVWLEGGGAYGKVGVVGGLSSEFSPCTRATAQGHEKDG